MARTKRTRHTVSMDDKITAMQAKVIRAKKRYDAAVKALEALMEKREESRRRELMDAVRRSDHTYEEILCFIRG